MKEKTSTKRTVQPPKTKKTPKKSPPKKVDKKVEEKEIFVQKAPIQVRSILFLKEQEKKIRFLIHKLFHKQHEQRKRTIAHAYFKRRESDLQLLLFPMILLVILFTVSAINNQLYRSNTAHELPTDILNTQLQPYPFVQSIEQPDLSAEAALILDRNSQVVLLAKNSKLRFSMASTTKIMTALTALDYFAMNDVLTVKSANVEGSGLGLIAGDRFYFEDLLYMMLLPSANDAAQTIADNYPGGSDAFINKMNEKANTLRLHDTHFADPTGLNDDGDYTTALDLARLASHAIAHPTFVEVTSTKYQTVQSIGYGGIYELENLNELLGVGGVTGIKTGTTEGAGQVLVTSTVKNGNTFIIVVLRSENRFSDTRQLLQYIDTNVQYVEPQLPEVR